MPSLKILVADDVPSNTELLTVMLTSLGHQVLSVADAPSAVRLALDQAPDLIFMDIVMPGEYDGLEAIRRLKQTPGFSAAIICQTAQASVDHLDAAHAAGADRCLTKPFKYKDVLDLLAHYEGAVDMRQRA